MLSLRDVSFGLYGAWRLARRDPQAMVWFDRSVAGVVRSFWAAAVCYPGVVIPVLLQASPSDFQSGAVYRVLLIETLANIIAWCAFPLAALPLCRWVASEERALGFIAAYNWAQVPQTVLMLLIGAAAAFNFAPDYAVAFVVIVAYLACFTYEWFIARIALDAGRQVATVLVLLDLVLSLIVLKGKQLLFGQALG
jgi:hypothetical protein